MQAFLKCNRLRKGSNINENDYISKPEFRTLIKHLKRYYAYWYAFKLIDNS